MLLVFLQESSVKALEGQDEAASSTDQPQQNVTNAISHLRRKLSFSSRDQTHSENETTSPLPEISALSQTTSSHLSMRSSPSQVSSPPATTQVSCYERASHVIIKLLFSSYKTLSYLICTFLRLLNYQRYQNLVDLLYTIFYMPPVVWLRV